MINKWSLELLNKASAAVEDEKSRALAERDLKSVLGEFLQKFLDESAEDDPVHDAYRVYYGIASIGMLADCSAATPAQAVKLERLIKGILLRNKVKPRKSSLGHVYRQLAEVMGYLYAQQGELETAIWEVSIGHTLAQGSSQKPSEISQFTYAHLALNNGSATLACRLFLELRTGSNSRYWQQAGLIGEIKSLRLSGQRESSAKLLEEFSNATSIHPRIQEHVHWEQLMHCMPRDLGVWIANQDAEGMQPALAVRLALWLYTQSISTAYAQNLKQLRKIRGSIKKTSLDHPTKTGLSVWKAFDTLYDTSIPFEVRLRHAGLLMEQISKMYIDTRCFTLVALHRWVQRNSQSHLSFLVEDEYRSLSLRLSQGMNDDVMGLMDNVAKGRIQPDLFSASYPKGTACSSVIEWPSPNAAALIKDEEKEDEMYFSLRLSA